MVIVLAVLIVSFVGATQFAGAIANGRFLPAGHSCHPSIESRPREIVLSCAHGMEYVESLTWSRWDPSSAVGTGRLMQNSCVPGCSGGSIVSRGAVYVDATSPRSVAGLRVFTRLRLTKVAGRSYALLAWGATSSSTSTWDWITPSFVPAPSAKGLVLDAATMHLDGVPPIPDAPDIIMNAVETEVYYALTPRLGPPKVMASTICHGALRVTVDQWQDLSRSSKAASQSSSTTTTEAGPERSHLTPLSHHRLTNSGRSSPRASVSGSEHPWPQPAR